MEDIVTIFCSYSYENSINEKMLYYDYNFPLEEVLEYVNQVINIPVERLLEVALHNSEEKRITAKDVFQFSNWDDATYRICTVIKAAKNPGVTYLDAGKLLLNDGKIRKNGAFIKYGENHAKTASSLGLLYELTHVFFLSCVGYVSDQLNDDQKERLLIRLILRSKLIQKLYAASQNGKVDVRQFLFMLSDSTYRRRRSNIKTVTKVLENSREFNFTNFLSKLEFK